MDMFDLDFSTLQDIPAQGRCQEISRVSVTPRGDLAMNGAFRREVGELRTFRARYSPDGRYLVFYTRETPNIHFSAKNGRVSHKELARQLASKGVQLPAVYTMAWCEEQGAWVGCSRELPPPPSLSALGRPRRSRSAAGRQA